MAPEERSPARSNDRCAASNAAAMQLCDRLGLTDRTGRTRCESATESADSASGCSETLAKKVANVGSRDNR